MAETASSVITDALQEILVAASEQPIEGSEMQNAIRYMNRMMFEFDAKGIALGYTEVTNPAQVITIPSGAINGLIFNLALRLAPQYDEIRDLQGTMFSAREGLKAMRRIAVKVGATEFPSTLPVGSGSEQDLFNSDHFYPDLESTILAETNGSISLEDDTV